MNTVNHQAEENRLYREFATRHAAREYRDPLADCYEAHWRFNEQFLEGRLRDPHFRFGRTAARSLSHSSEYTGYGAEREVTINDGLVLNPNPQWVLKPWPDQGLRLFVHALIWKQAVRQYVLEIENASEVGYEGFGPRFCAVANRIALDRGWAQVIARRRRPEDAATPLGKGWPHNVMLLADPDCFGDALTQSALDLATGGSSALRTLPAPPSLGLLELLLYQLNGDKVDCAREVLSRHIDRLQEERMRRLPRNSKAERGETDLDGSPLHQPTIDPAWLSWENGAVRKLLDAILAWRSFGELPILADALEEAGCTDDCILRHLRARIEHTKHCWVLRLLLAADPTRPEG